MINLLLKNIKFEFITGPQGSTISLQADLETPPVHAKFIEFLKEKKLQDAEEDPLLEWKNVILSWFENINTEKNKTPKIEELKLQSLNIFWCYFSKLIQDPKYRKSPIHSIRDLKAVLDRESLFYKEILQITKSPKVSDQWKLKQLKVYEDKGMLLNINHNYHPTIKSAPFFITLTLFLKITPIMAAKLSIKNFEDLKILFDFYCQEIDPNIADFELNQEPEAYIQKFIDDFSQKIDEIGIKKLYHEQIVNIDKEVTEAKQKAEELKQLAKRKEAILKEHQQKQIQQQKELLNDYKKSIEKKFKEFTSSIIEIKVQETTENELLLRAKISQKVAEFFFYFQQDLFLQEKKIQNKTLLHSLKEIQQLYQRLHVEPFLIQLIQEPSERQNLLKEKTTEIKALKFQEITERKLIEKTQAERKKTSYLFAIFFRKQAYELQKTLPSYILEAFHRKDILVLETMEFFNLLQKKNQADKVCLKKLEQNKRKQIENDGLHLTENPTLQTYLLTMILQSLNREKIKSEQDVEFSNISHKKQIQKKTFAIQDQIQKCLDFEARSRQTIDLEASSLQLLKRHVPYGNIEFPWTVKNL